uniref:Uncharacterized protein n=1 Tax=Ignisphaera aggregans TaxID=334771 RepID=A0A7C4FFG2_9CREN
MLYIHIGAGSPWLRSYHIIECDTFTSGCAKTMYRNGERLSAVLVDKVFQYMFEHVSILQKPVHMYKYSNRVYRVYTYSKELKYLLETAISFAYTLRKYCRDRSCYYYVLRSAFAYCSSTESCLKSLEEWLRYMNRISERRRRAGRKALLTRLERATRMCKAIVSEYFPDLEKPPVFKVDERGYAECVSNAVKVLSRIFAQNVARRYAESICSGGNSIYIFARDSIIAVDVRYSPRDVRVYYESCIDAEKYAMVKLVAVVTTDREVNEVDWVALLGYDKLANQLFLHYVPPTLLLADIERARLWLLGLVDNWGRRELNFALVET